MAARTKDRDSAVFDEVEGLRTDYLRELSGLSKILITFSTAALGLTLSQFGIGVANRAGSVTMLLVWLLLFAGAVLGFVQLFTFSTRFKSRADYLWACHLVDTLLALQASDDKLNEFLSRSDQHKSWYDRKYKICLALVVGQAVCLFAAFGVLGVSMYRFLASGSR